MKTVVHLIIVSYKISVPKSEKRRALTHYKNQTVNPLYRTKGYFVLKITQEIRILYACKMLSFLKLEYVGQNITAGT